MELQLQHLSKCYGAKQAVNDVSTVLTPGVYGLLGANGAGKTTLMRMICGVLKPTSGSICLNGKSIDELGEDYYAHLGYMPQDFGFYPDFTAREFMLYMAAVKGLDKKEAATRAGELLKLVNLHEVADKKIKSFSGGMKQRLGIAQAELNAPDILILDEPTVAVDPQSRNKILEGIVELNRRGATILYTSHYMDEVEQICSRIAIIDQGKNLALGTTEELKKLIKKSEIITIDILTLTEEDLAAIRQLPHIYEVSFDQHKLTVLCSGGQHNLIHVLDYLQKKSYSFGYVHSELPSLNDVFLEITGKELRD